MGRTGSSRPDFFGGYSHYDKNGRKTGTTHTDFYGGYSHYDTKGRKTGRSRQNFYGGYTHETTSGGCYIATAVYGSYDCPPVWTLRRFRDRTLSASLPGRLFIRLYYALSPAAVRLFGRNRLFCAFWRYVLDKWTARLREKGYADTPYADL